MKVTEAVINESGVRVSYTTSNGKKKFCTRKAEDLAPKAIKVLQDYFVEHGFIKDEK